MTAISFESFMELALYGDGGSYYKSSTQKSARRGDYITSVEVGPLFGVVLAKALDSWWAEAGKPDPFYVFDAGAGVGTLGRSIVRAKPACLSALKYLMVEQSEYLVSRQADLIDAEPDIFQSLLVGRNEANLLGNNPLGLKEPVDFGVVIANELLDNLPIMLLEKTSQKNQDTPKKQDSKKQDSWAEVWVTLAAPDLERPDIKNPVASGTTVSGEELMPISPELVELADELAPGARPGSRIPIARQSLNWLAGAAGCLKKGRVLVLDYGVLATSELASRPQSEWLRTYFSHKSGSSPYKNIGKQDITCEVPFDQLTKTPASQTPAIKKPVIKSQAEFLAQWGILDLLPTPHPPLQLTLHPTLLQPSACLLLCLPTSNPLNFTAVKWKPKLCWIPMAWGHIWQWNGWWVNFPASHYFLPVIPGVLLYLAVLWSRF